MLSVSNPVTHRADHAGPAATPALELLPESGPGDPAGRLRVASRRGWDLPRAVRLAAAYFVTATWFDVARVDSLFTALSVAALYAARWMRRSCGAVATGLLLAAASLTKQNGLAEGVAVLTVLGFGPRRRLAWPAALTYGAVLGISTLALGLASHGWYVYYVFVLMTEHTLKYAAFGQFWTVHLLPVLGIACCALVLGARRIPLVLFAGCV